MPRDIVVIAEDDRNLAQLARPGCIAATVSTASGRTTFIIRCVVTSPAITRAISGATAAPPPTSPARSSPDGSSADRSPTSGKPRGTDPSPLSLEQFVVTLQNHDQIGNRPFGDRLINTVNLPTYRAASALLLCAPETPLLFMGQEWGATTPFSVLYRSPGRFGRAVTEGRRSEFAGFSAFGDPALRETIPDPQSAETFNASRLRWHELADDSHQRTLRLYQALIAERRSHPALLTRDRNTVTAVALDESTVAVWRQVPDAEQIVLVARLSDGEGTVRLPGRWTVVLSTEDPAFAVDGCPPSIDVEGGGVRVRFGRPSALLLRQSPAD